MSKRPSYQFYPSDWRADPVFGCSIAARGLWHEMMNMMHASERYGYLSQSGKPIPDEAIARYCAVTPEEYETLLGELDSAGVPRRTKSGIVYSKRMVEDEEKREDWRERQGRHRGPNSHVDVTRDKGVTETHKTGKSSVRSQKFSDDSRPIVRVFSGDSSVETSKGMSNQDVSGTPVTQVSRASHAALHSSSSSSKLNSKPRPQRTRPVPSSSVDPPKAKALTPQQEEYLDVKKLVAGAVPIVARARSLNLNPASADVREELKAWAAVNGFDYNSDSISKALEVAEGRAKAAAGHSR